MTTPLNPSTQAPPATGIGQPRRLRANSLDPEAQALLKVLNLAARKPVDMDNLQRKRRSWALSAQVLGHAAPVAKVETLHIPGPAGKIELRVYRPSTVGRAVPAFLWIYGGGFVVGGLATADAICRHIAQASGAAVVAVRYRMVPEHDLYAGREDCLAALQWLAREGRRVGIDGASLAIGGDSAGGNMAAAVAQRFLAQGGQGLRLQVLVYPATNLRDDCASKAENAKGYLLSATGMDAIKRVMTRDDPDLSDPWLSPALAPDLAGLPPALVLVAGFDPIRDDGLAYVQRLRQAGVAVDLLNYAGQFHGFLNFNGVLRSARDALDRMSEALQRSLLVPASRVVPMDRTTEVIVKAAGDYHTWPGLRLSHDAALLGLMMGERMESLGAAMVRRMVPGLRGLSAMPPLLKPFSTYRTVLAQGLAPLKVQETYRGTAAGSSS